MTTWFSRPGLGAASTPPALETFVRRHPAVHHAEASYLSETVTVGYDESRISEAEIRGLIEQCGFHCQGASDAPTRVRAGGRRAAAHRPPALTQDHARHVVAQEPASAREPAAVSTEMSAHEMGHGPGMGMEGMVRDTRRSFWVTFMLAIAVSFTGGCNARQARP